MTTPAEKREMAATLEGKWMEADAVTIAAALREAAEEQEFHASVVEHWEERYTEAREMICRQSAQDERAARMREALDETICLLSEEAERAQEMREALASGEASDGYHTHRELYEYRMLYNAHAARGWLAVGLPVVKSRKHSDGTSCFGGGWFIVVAELPTGQISNHYESEHWGLFDVPEVDLAPAYDGHTPADVAERLARAILGGTDDRR
jgi:hypothetical protein